MEFEVLIGSDGCIMSSLSGTPITSFGYYVAPASIAHRISSSIYTRTDNPSYACTSPILYTLTNDNVDILESLSVTSSSATNIVRTSTSLSF